MTWSYLRLRLVVAVVLLTGCAPRPQPLSPDGVATLAADEALLILHVDSDVPIKELLLDRGSAARSLQAGEHVWIVRAAPGSYRWSMVLFGANAGRAERHRLESEDEYRFDVRGGHINYGGALVIRSPHWQRSAGHDVTVRHRNHAAMAIRALLPRHASLLARFPLHHGGSAGDRFLVHYQTVRDRTQVPE